MPEEELPKSRKPKRDVVDVLLNIDHKKATKYLVKGMIIAIIFGAIALTSKSIASNADDWFYWQSQDLEINYMNGNIGYDEFTKQTNYLNSARYFLRFQEAYVVNIARIGVDIGLIFVLVAFIAYASNKELDSKMRLLAFVLAGVVMTVIMGTAMFSNLSVSVS